MNRAAGFLMIPVYTRYLSPKSYGGMEMIEILASAIALFVAMGVVEALPRSYYAETDQSSKNRVVSTAIIGLSLIGIPLVAFFLLISQTLSGVILADSQVYRCLQIAILSAWSFGLSETVGIYFRMTYQSRLFLIISPIGLVLAVSLNIIFIVVLHYDILGFFLSTLISQGLMGISLSIIILRRIGFCFSWKVFVRMISFGFPLVFPQIALMLGFASNRFFLRWTSGVNPTEALTLVGLLALGHKFGVIVNRFINSPINYFWSPRRLELVIRDADGDRATIGRMATYGCMISVYFSLMLSNASESLLSIFADPRYYKAHVVVPLVALAYSFLSIETHLKAGILKQRKTSRDAILSIVALAVILGWNYFLIPKYGLIAAAAASSVGFCIRLILMYYVSQSLFRIPFEIGRILSMFMVAAILYFLGQTVHLHSVYMTLIIRSGIGLLFPLVLLLCSFYHPEEIVLAREAALRLVGFVKKRFA